MTTSYHGRLAKSILNQKNSSAAKKTWCLTCHWSWTNEHNKFQL